MSEDTRAKIPHMKVYKSVVHVHRQTFNSLETYWLGIGFTSKFVHPFSRAVILFYVFNESSLHYNQKVYAALLHVLKLQLNAVKFSN